MDRRHLANGRTIPSYTYSDQPYVVRTDDGAWLCCMTTGAGREGQPGQTVIATRSTDQGRTWSTPVEVEPSDGPEASYAVLLKAPTGRIYCFYNHNSEDRRWVIGDDPPYAGGRCRRVDSQGHYVCKYSDDHGRTWSAQRYEIPVRPFEIDRENPYRGEIRYFWNVGRPFIHAERAYLSLHKVGGLGEGFFTRSEGVLLRSDNLLHEQNPDWIRWETLPEGEIGLRAPTGGGPVAEEQSYCVLSDGSFHSIYRTIDGHPACTYSRDGGRSWSAPEYARYADGRRIKHPRAANFAWRCENGKYLYWFHNHGGSAIREHPERATYAYQNRNPVWLCGGTEVATAAGPVIAWSQPEIVLYDDDPLIRISYPDLVEEAGRFYLTETQKDVARVHEIDPRLLDALWTQGERCEVAREGLLLDIDACEARIPASAAMPALSPLLRHDGARADHGAEDLRGGLTVECAYKLDSVAPGQTLISNRTAGGAGFRLGTCEGGAIELLLGDGQTECRWCSDPGLLRPGEPGHVVAIVDGGPKVIMFVVDGMLCDGGDHRQFGWGRYNPHLRDLNGDRELRLGIGVQMARLYDRALLVSEAIGNYRSYAALC